MVKNLPLQYLSRRRRSFRRSPRSVPRNRQPLTARVAILYRRATQTVFGEGRAHAAVVFVGEQPGDAEDLEGKPFVESPLAPVVMATVHPSSVLRAQTDDERRVAMEAFVADLRSLAKKLSG